MLKQKFYVKEIPFFYFVSHFKLGRIQNKYNFFHMSKPKQLHKDNHNFSNFVKIGS